MFHQKNVVFEAVERLSTGEHIVYTDPTAAIMRGRALQGIYIGNLVKSMFSAIATVFAPLTDAVKSSWKHYRSSVELLKLDDRMLSDIGISRAEAVAIATGKRSPVDQTSQRAAAAHNEAPRGKLKVPAHFRQAAA